MTADTLRRAAALMRERAEAATPGPWSHGGSGVASGDRVICKDDIATDAAMRDGAVPGWLEVMEQDRRNGEHIASWHPAVALAVADWLDYQANDLASSVAIWEVSSKDPKNGWAERGLTVEANVEHHYRNALAVARAYLGGDA